ncbi:MAG: hypothetical protein AAB527_03680 [Patescibacteria group bacterium]
MSADVPKVAFATCKKCHRVLERLPEIYLYPREAFLGCEYCDTVTKYDILDIGILENPEPYGTYKEYKKRLAGREAGVV